MFLPPCAFEYQKLIYRQLFDHQCIPSEIVQRAFLSKVVIFQLMVDGVTLETGQSAQQHVEEGLRLEPEPVQILFLDTGEPIVMDKALRTGIATLMHVQVNIV